MQYSKAGIMNRAKIKNSLSKMLKSKKSILFSLMALILLLPVFIVSTLHLENNEKQNSHANKYIYAQRIKYIEDDIASDILDLLNYNATLKRESGINQIKFNNITLLDPSPKLQDYEDFIENKYSGMINNNVEINVTNTSSLMDINNMNLSVRNYSFELNNITNIYNLTLHIKALEPYTLNDTSMPGNDPDGINVNIIVENNYDERVIERQMTLNINESNSLFVAKNNMTNVTVGLSNYLLNITSTINTRVELLDIGFGHNRSVELSSGNISIPEYLGISKKSRIVLMKS